jgi:DnaK suppressor protein
MAVKEVTKVPKFRGKKKEFFELLMAARESIVGQMEFHAGEALTQNGSGAESRGMATHMADLGSDNSRHEMELQLLTEEGDVLESIEEALERLKNNEFGLCLDCGDEIPEARLRAKPHAQCCIKCKSIREQNGGINPYVD